MANQNTHVSTNSTRPLSPLAEYLTNVLYMRWRSDRADLETKWTSNDCTIRKIRQEDWKEGEGEDWRADNSIGLVKGKLLAGVALVLDFILEGGMLGFGMKVNELGKRITPEEIEQHSDQIAAAEQAIRTEFEAGRIDKETKKAVFSCGKYGSCWGHYYTDKFRQEIYEKVEREFAVQDPGQERYVHSVIERDMPFAEWVPNWEMYWDQTEDEVDDMEGLCREQNIAPYTLRKFARNGEGWIPEEIEFVIEENKGSELQSRGQGQEENIAPGRRDFHYNSKTIKYREFWTRVPKSVVEDYQKDMKTRVDDGVHRGISNTTEIFDGMDDNSGHELCVFAVTANDVIVRFQILPEYERKPFYYVPWEDTLDGIQGLGVADNGYQLGEIYNGLFNAYQDNKKLVCDVQGFYNELYFGNDESMTIEPGKFRPAKNMTKEAVANAVHQLVFTDVGENLLNMIGLVSQMADEEMHIPKVAQGAEGDIQKTAFETEQLVEKSGKYIAQVIGNFDDNWTEPIANDFHRFNMQDPERTEGQGDFIATGTGFTTFEAKTVRMAKLFRVMEMALGSAELTAMTKLIKVWEEIMRASDLDPDEFMYTEEESQERFQALQPPEMPEEDPEQAQLEKEKAQADINKTKVDTQVALADQARKNEELKLKQVEALKPEVAQTANE